MLWMRHPSAGVRQVAKDNVTLKIVALRHQQVNKIMTKWGLIVILEWQELVWFLDALFEANGSLDTLVMGGMRGSAPFTLTQAATLAYPPWQACTLGCRHNKSSSVFTFLHRNQVRLTDFQFGRTGFEFISTEIEFGSQIFSSFPQELSWTQAENLWGELYSCVKKWVSVASIDAGMYTARIVILLCICSSTYAWHVLHGALLVAPNISVAHGLIYTHLRSECALAVRQGVDEAMCNTYMWSN